jgi:hypothetical protein
MARITSQKIRQMILMTTTDPLAPGEFPEGLVLYQPNGQPLDLTRDSTRMLWRGEWSDDEIYYKNDVVIDEGDLFILRVNSVSAHSESPSSENTVVDDGTIPVPGDDNSGFSAYPLDDGERVVPVYSAPQYVYFDLGVGGTVSISDLDLPAEYILLYDSTGEQIGTNYGAPGPSGYTNFGNPLVKELEAGRYFVRWIEAVLSDPGSLHLKVELSDGAQYAPPVQKWEVLFRATSGPAGPPGEAGAPGASGNSFLEGWRGDWEDNMYSQGSFVRYDNGLYVAKRTADYGETPGVSPETSPWELVIQGV